MSEGELKKRILQWIDDDKVSYYDTNGNDIADLQKVLDAEKKEFPTSGIGDSHENAVINGMHKTQQWFKKWFGDST